MTVAPQLACLQRLYDPNQIKPVETIWHVKPRGGLWSSTYTPHEKYCSAWVKWCASVRPDWLEGVYCYILYPSESARVYVIDDYEDLVELNKRFKWPLWRLKPQERRTKIFDLLKGHVHWEEVSKYYDGVMVTEHGEWSTRPLREINLSGWDCESTLWFRDVFDKVVKVEEDITRRCRCKKIDFYMFVKPILRSYFVGYRTEMVYGEGYRKINDVLEHEIVELGNTDIFEYLYKHRIIDTKDKDQNLSFRIFIDLLIENDYTECIWLCNTREDVRERYCDGEDCDIDKYTITNAIILSDLGEEGLLVAYNPNKIKKERAI